MSKRMMTKFVTGLSAGLISILLIGPSAYAAHHEFDCKTALSGSSGERHDVISNLLQSTWDTAKLSCAGDALIAESDQDPENIDAMIAALRANARTVYYMDRIVLYDLGYLIVSYTTDVPMETMVNQPMIDLMAAQEAQLALLKRSREAGFESDEISYFEALALGPTGSAMPLLEEVISADPKEIAGAAHAQLGEIYYSLPDILGGDLDQAIKMMRAARKRAPDNPYYARMLAAYLLDVGNTDEAATLLASLMSIKAETDELQLVADQLRIAADIASRIPDQNLANELVKQRNAMLESHSYLQNRKVVAALGHFGDKNPMEE